jgi:transcription elongation factor GreA
LKYLCLTEEGERLADVPAVLFLFILTHPPRATSPDRTMATINYYTAEGLQKLKDELQDLKIRGRAKAAEDLREARDKGDLSENAEYDAAKDAQGLLELKISKLEEVVGNARVLDETNMDFSKVLIQSKVKLKNLKNNMVLDYVLVAEEEANLAAGKISIKSPIGKGLLGKEAGDVAEIIVPAGKLQFEILEVSR